MTEMTALALLQRNKDRVLLEEGAAKVGLPAEPCLVVRVRPASQWDLPEYSSMVTVHFGTSRM